MENKIKVLILILILVVLAVAGFVFSDFFKVFFGFTGNSVRIIG